MIGNVIYLVIMLTICAYIVWQYPRNQRKKAISSLCIWIVIIFSIISLYSFRYDLLNNSVIANLIPGYAYTDNQYRVNFKKAANGHFYIIAKIGTTSIKFLVDTGATDVALSPHDAKRLNINLAELEYTKRYNTANGTIEGAPVMIKKIKIGPLTLENVAAVVNRSDMKESLLGMSALSEFDVSISNDTLTIS